MRICLLICMGDTSFIVDLISLLFFKFDQIGIWEHNSRD